MAGAEHTTVLVTGTSSGFGAMTVRRLADAGHTVWAGMRDLDRSNARAAADARSYATKNGVDLRPVEMDVSDQASVDAAVAEVSQAGPIDVLVHNAGHMVLGPLEAFTVEDLTAMYDVNALSTQRVNRAVLPQMRTRRDGLVVWVGSTSTRGATPPFLGPYFAAKSAEESLAQTYAVELAPFGIETSIVVPGSYTSGTEHFAHAGHPSDTARADEYSEAQPGMVNDVVRRLGALSPADADPGAIAVEIARIVGLPKGQRPFRTVIDPADDGAATVFTVADELRRLFYGRLGLTDLLSPSPTSPTPQTSPKETST